MKTISMPLPHLALAAWVLAGTEPGITLVRIPDSLQASGWNGMIDQCARKAHLNATNSQCRTDNTTYLILNQCSR